MFIKGRGIRGVANGKGKEVQKYKEKQCHKQKKMKKKRVKIGAKINCACEW
jgi:hypothetical protein